MNCHDLETFGFNRVADVFDATLTKATEGGVSFDARVRFYDQQKADITQWQQTKEGWQKLS